ncbi:YcxB family protein [Streptomyces sp. NBC_00320]|uniref:YcxB family protein n=1 Tax=unclassified Streptomyces TaxID=2593676 RepID=UPI00225AC23D|nr:YcxB family protein [Streptomyces sp. NBC_00320]MCX5149992.1 YcxB family protein [Streptomyces sp. NBC_00320]
MATGRTPRGARRLSHHAQRGGLTTTGASGQTVTADWSSYPWWFETPDLFVLTGSMEFFFVLPKRGAACPEDLDQTRALFTQRLRRI